MQLSIYIILIITLSSSINYVECNSLNHTESLINNCASNVFPCSDKIVGNVVLISVFGTILAIAAKMIADGAELLLDLGLPSALIGGLVLPILGVVPDTAMILVSGLGPKNIAQSKLSVGMGTLAGSTILLLTNAWGISLLLGRLDLIKDGRKTVAISGRSTGFSLHRQGVELKPVVAKLAIIMMITALPYLIVQSADWYFGPTLLHVVQPSYVKYAALATFIICMIFFIAYNIFQVFLTYKIGTSARIERHKAKKRVNFAAKAFLMAMHPDKPTSGKMDSCEHDAFIQKKYFCAWKVYAKSQLDDESQSSQDIIDDEDQEPKWKIAIKSILKLFVGVILVTFFSDPMCSALNQLTNSANPQYIPISPFYLSFIITPICSNASELISSFIFAFEKDKDVISLSYSQLYGAVTMINTLGLGVFAALVFFRDLEWYFSAEVTVILLVEFIIGITALVFYRIYYVYLAIPVKALYLLAFAMVIVLELGTHWG